MIKAIQWLWQPHQSQDDMSSSLEYHKRMNRGVRFEDVSEIISGAQEREAVLIAKPGRYRGNGYSIVEA